MLKQTIILKWYTENVIDIAVSTQFASESNCQSTYDALQ